MMPEEKTITLGLVDDHNMFRQGIARFLNDEPDLEVVLQAKGGEELLELINKKNAPDICIVDINMDGMQGFELVKRMTAAYPDTKLIALSMLDDEISIIRMIKNGARGYVLKGSDPEELLRAISVTHQNGYYHNDIMAKAFLHSVKDESGINLKEVELVFLKYCCSELSYKEIASKMSKSPSTIDNYRGDLFEKLHVSSRTGLVLYAIKNGIVKLDL